MSEVIECMRDFDGNREYAAYEHGLDGNLYYYTEAAYQEWLDKGTIIGKRKPSKPKIIAKGVYVFEG